MEMPAPMTVIIFFPWYGIWKRDWDLKYSGIVINPKERHVAQAAPAIPHFGIKIRFKAIFDMAPMPR